MIGNDNKNSNWGRAGRYITQIGGYKAFIPKLLPPDLSFDSFSCRNCGDMRHGSKLAKICVSLSVEDWPCFMALPRLPRLPTSGLSAPIWKRSPQPTFQ